MLVPTIDIAPIVTGRSSGSARDREAVARAVDDAARTVGFMQVVGHGVPDAVIAGLAAAMDGFFGLPAAVKHGYRQPPEINRGYTPPKSEALANSLGLASAADLFEAFNVGAGAGDYPGLDLDPVVYPANVWPAEVAGFESAVQRYFAAARGVAHAMTDVFATALGTPPGHFAALTDHSIDVLRMNNYRLPAATDDLLPDQLGMGAHTDYGIVTVLWADPVPGLHILLDGEWHPVTPDPGALLVNLGDALARWTNDHWLSTMHRVAPPVVDGRLVPRRSAAFFHDGNVDAVIDCLPTCTSADDPPRYAPVTVGEHLAHKLAGSRAGVLNPHAEREAARLTTAG